MNNSYNYDLYKNNMMMDYPTNTMPVEKQPLFAEDVLAKNKGKHIKVYMSFTDSKEWCDRIFEGNLEAWGRDFILLNDTNSNKRYMVWNLYIDFIEFFDQVNI